jgi:hypothetical protein
MLIEVVVTAASRVEAGADAAAVVAVVTLAP